MSESDNNWPISDGKISFKDIIDARKGETGFIPIIKVQKIRGNVLCTFEPSDTDKYSVTIECSGEEKRNVMESLRMVGLLDLTFTYTKSKEPFVSAPRTKNIRETDFQTWFKEVINDKTLVPDTNSILNHTFSSLVRIFGDVILNNVKIRIPRLVILEMERRANSKSSVDCNNPTNEKEKCYCKDKRSTMLGYEEIMFLRNNGAELFPDIDSEILARFTQIAGELTSDSWIRREIKDYRANVIKAKLAIGGSSDPGPIPHFIFVSSDLINSLSSSAEGIDSIYISKPLDVSATIASREQVAKFLIYHSVTTEDLKVTFGSKQYEIKGFWSGKTTFDILNDRIMIKSL